MKKTVLLIGILTFLMSCQSRKEKNEIETELKNSEKNLVKIKVNSTLTTQYIENDSITHSWITELTKISKNDKRFKVQQELRSNRHWDYMDTIITLTYDKTILTVI